MEKFVALKLALEKLAEEVDGEVKPYTTEEAHNLVNKKFRTLKNISKGVGRGVLEAGIGHILGYIPAVAYGVYANNKLNRLGNNRGTIDEYAHRKLLNKIQDFSSMVGRIGGAAHGAISSSKNTHKKIHDHLMQTDPRYRKWEELPEEDK